MKYDISNDNETSKMTGAWGAGGAGARAAEPRGGSRPECQNDKNVHHDNNHNDDNMKYDISNNNDEMWYE